MEIIKGNLLDIEKGFIFQQVNCQGAYGAGLSGAISKKWPKVEERYRNGFLVNLEESGDDTNKDEKPPSDFEWLGHFDPIMVEDNIIVCNIYGQLYYGGNERQTDYCAIAQGLSLFRLWLESFKGEEQYQWSKYFPKLFGAGLAKGDSKTIHRIIEHYISDAILVEL